MKRIKNSLETCNRKLDTTEEKINRLKRDLKKLSRIQHRETKREVLYIEDSVRKSHKHLIRATEGEKSWEVATIEWIIDEKFAELTKYTDLQIHKAQQTSSLKTEKDIHT